MELFPAVYLARHGETAWSISGQHTGLTDLPLTEHGESNARLLGKRLSGITFEKVYTSPLRRAIRTCELAGFGSSSAIDTDLVEWNYGKYEGRRTSDILAERPGWLLFRDGCPDGESPGQVTARVARIVQRVREVPGNVLLFSSAHLLRVLAVNWLGLETLQARAFVLSTGSLSKLGYKDDPRQSAILLWNDTCHLEVTR